MKIADAMRARMQEKNWNADELARRAELARSTIFKLLADEPDTRTSTLRKLKRVGVKHPLLEAL